MVGILLPKEIASSLGREELLNFGMVPAVCSGLGLCVRVRRGPGRFGLPSEALCSLILHVGPSSTPAPGIWTENPSFSGYCVTVS